MYRLYRINGFLSSVRKFSLVYNIEVSRNGRKWQYAFIPDSKVHGANMGPIWGRQDPGGPNLGPMNFAIWNVFQ